MKQSYQNRGPDHLLVRNIFNETKSKEIEVLDAGDGVVEAADKGDADVCKEEDHKN